MPTEEEINQQIRTLQEQKLQLQNQQLAAQMEGFFSNLSKEETIQKVSEMIGSNPMVKIFVTNWLKKQV